LRWDEAFAAKRRLARMLHGRGDRREDIVRLYRFIDWVLRLPEDLEFKLEDGLKTLEGRKSMPSVSSIERHGVAKGRKEGRGEGLREGLRAGLLEAIASGLKLRFGQEGLDLLPRVREVREPRRLRPLLAAVLKAKSIENLRGRLRPA